MPLVLARKPGIGKTEAIRKALGSMCLRHREFWDLLDRDQDGVDEVDVVLVHTLDPDRVRLDLSERFMEAVHDYADIFGHHPRIEGDPICLGLMVKFEDGKAMVLDRHKFLNYIKEKLPESCPYTRTCFIGKEEA